MHILYVIAPSGGPEAYVKVLCPWLVKRGHKVTVLCICPPNRQNLSFPSNIEVLYAAPGTLHYYLSKVTGGFRDWPVRLRALETELAVEKLAREIEKSEKIDLIEVTEGMPISRLNKEWPVLVRAHGSDWLFRQHCHDGNVRWDNLLIRDASLQFGQARVVSPISSDLADQLSSNCKIPRDTFKAIPYPIDTSFFSPEGPKIDLPGSPVLLSIGRLEHRKGTDVLLKALCLAWDRYPDLKIYLLGKEAEYSWKQVLQMIPKKNRDKVSFPGFVPHFQLPEYYRAAEIYLAPTQYETFGYTILEAMACAKPVISCSVGAVPELVKDGENGLLVRFGQAEDLAQAILYLLDNPEIALAMGRKGRQFAEAYSVEKIGEQLEMTYSDAVVAKTIGTSVFGKRK